MSKTLPQVFESHDIFDATIPDSGKGCVIKMKSGSEIHCSLHIKPTVMSDGRSGVFEANKAEALDEFMNQHHYDIAVHKVQYEQELRVYNDQTQKAGERLDLMKEMGITKYEVTHLTRLNKALVTFTMTDGKVHPFYIDHDVWLDDEGYATAAAQQIKEMPELWALPSDGSQLMTNSVREAINKTPSRILKL